jgi:two-component system, NtrC family, response regulator HydG
VERAVILCDGEFITREQLPPDMAARGPENGSFRLPFGLTLDAVEKEYILVSLERNGGNKARTAEMLGVSEKTLYNKLNRYAAEARGEFPFLRKGSQQPSRGPPQVGTRESDLSLGGD